MQSPYYEPDSELREPLTDVEAFLDCARYNDGDDAEHLKAYLVQCPSDIDAQDSHGRTAVHMASANGHMTILEMLFDFRPTPDIPNEEGNTALHFAALNSQVEVARQLLLRGWSASKRNAFQKTPLQLIEGKHFDKMETLLLLNDKELDGFAQDGVTVSFDTEEAADKCANNRNLAEPCAEAVHAPVTMSRFPNSGVRQIPKRSTNSAAVLGSCSFDDIE